MATMEKILLACQIEYDVSLDWAITKTASIPWFK